MNGRSSAEDIPAYLQELTAVAIARVQGDGVLAETNRGFRSLVGCPDSPMTARTVADLHLHPPIHDLTPGPDAPEGTLLYQGTLSFQGPGARVVIPGRIYRSADGWLIVGEPGLETLERLRLSARRLQHELAETHQQIRHQVEHRDGTASTLASRLDQMLQNELAALEQLVQTSPAR